MRNLGLHYHLRPTTQQLHPQPQLHLRGSHCSHPLAPNNHVKLSSPSSVTSLLPLPSLPQIYLTAPLPFLYLPPARLFYLPPHSLPSSKTPPSKGTPPSTGPSSTGTYTCSLTCCVMLAHSTTSALQTSVSHVLRVAIRSCLGSSGGESYHLLLVSEQVSVHLASKSDGLIWSSNPRSRRPCSRLHLCR